MCLHKLMPTSSPLKLCNHVWGSFHFAWLHLWCTFITLCVCTCAWLCVSMSKGHTFCICIACHSNSTHFIKHLLHTRACATHYGYSTQHKNRCLCTQKLSTMITIVSSPTPSSLLPPWLHLSSWGPISCWGIVLLGRMCVCARGSRLQLKSMQDPTTLLPGISCGKSLGVRLPLSLKLAFAQRFILLLPPHPPCPGHRKLWETGQDLVHSQPLEDTWYLPFGLPKPTADLGCTPRPLDCLFPPLQGTSFWECLCHLFPTLSEKFLVSEGGRLFQCTLSSFCLHFWTWMSKAFFFASFCSSNVSQSSGL